MQQLKTIKINCENQINTQNGDRHLKIAFHFKARKKKKQLYFVKWFFELIQESDGLIRNKFVIQKKKKYFSGKIKKRTKSVVKDSTFFSVFKNKMVF